MLLERHFHELHGDLINLIGHCIDLVKLGYMESQDAPLVAPILVEREAALVIVAEHLIAGFLRRFDELFVLLRAIFSLVLCFFLCNTCLGIFVNLTFITERLRQGFLEEHVTRRCCVRLLLISYIKRLVVYLGWIVLLRLS